MQGFDTIFGLVVDTENTYEYTGDVYGLLHNYTRYRIIGVMLVSFNDMEFKQVSLEEFKSISLNNYSSNNWAENKWTSFLYPYDTEPVIIVDRYKYSGSNLIENVKTVRSFVDENDVILLYDKSGKLRIRSGCDIVAYQCTENIYLTVNLANHSIEFTTESRLYGNSLCVKDNYFDSAIDWNMISSLQHGNNAVLICMGEAEVVMSCDSVILPSEVRCLHLDEYVDVDKIVCNKEVEHFDGYSNRVREWFISKETSASFIVDLVKWCMEELLDDDDGSIATYGA